MPNIQATTDYGFNLNFVRNIGKNTVKCTVKISTHISAQSFVAFGQLVVCSFTNEMIVGSRVIAVTKTSDFSSVSRNEFPNIQTTTDGGFNQKFVRDMKKIYSQMHRKDKYSHLSSIICCLWSIG